MSTVIDPRTWRTKIDHFIFGSALLMTVLKLTASRIAAQVRVQSSSAETRTNLWHGPTILPEMLVMPRLMSYAVLPTRSNGSHSAKKNLLFGPMESWSEKHGHKHCLSDTKSAFEIA